MADLSQPEWTLRLQQDDDSFILDVRTQEEIEDGMIPNANHIDIHEGQGFIDKVEKLDKSKNYYIYCRSGGRSAQACAVMNQMGFENTFNLDGGFSEWAGEVQVP